jgi:DNA-binding transcriptional LysR family regulator
VRLGLGWTVLPTTQAEHGAHRLVRAMDEPLFSRTISAVTRHGGAVHPAAAPFIAALSA